MRAQEPKPPLEREIQSTILSVFRRCTWIFCMRNNSGSLPNETGRYISFGETGSTDLVCFLAPSGRAIGIEVKRPPPFDNTSKKRKEQQEAWRRAVGKFGVATIVACSLEDACEFAVEAYTAEVQRLGLPRLVEAECIQSARRELADAKDIVRVKIERKRALRARKLVIAKREATP